MKNTIKSIRIVLFIFIAAGVFASCKKESSSDDGCKTDMPHVAGTYKLTAVKYKMSSTTAEQGYLPFMEACETDNLIALNANGTYTFSDVGEKCTPDESSTGTWSIAGSTILCKESDILDQGIISAFDCKQLVLYRDDIIVKGDRMTLTLTKQ
jgi:hypothetical protein